MRKRKNLVCGRKKPELQGGHYSALTPALDPYLQKITELADRVFCIYILMGEEWHEHGSARAICLSSRPLCLPEVPIMRRHSFAIVPIGARNSIE